MTDQRKLFDCPDPPPKPEKYRPKAKGYAAPPGTGPEGETCRTCDYAHARRYGKNYWKCAKIGRHNWTCGPGTDIRLKSPACYYWKPKPEGAK